MSVPNTLLLSLSWTGPHQPPRGGLAGTSVERHSAAARLGPKSMSSPRQSAGKVLRNQMGFPPSLPTLFINNLTAALMLELALTSLLLWCIVVLYNCNGTSCANTRSSRALLLSQFLRTSLSNVGEPNHTSDPTKCMIVASLPGDEIRWH